MKINKNFRSRESETLSPNFKNLKMIPKVDLHCHSTTSVPIEFFKKIDPELKLPPKRFSQFTDFNRYITNNINPLIKNLTIFKSLLEATIQKFIEDGIVYAEMSFDLAIPEYINVSLDEFLDVINTERKAVSNRIDICPEIGVDREINPQKTLVLLKKALKRNIFGSIDLYGNERGPKIDEFKELYKVASKKGLKLKAHIGELGNALSIKEAVEKLNLDALQHGVKAIEDRIVLDYLINKGVVFNICPTSNLSLGIFKNIEDHPIRKLFDLGAIITIGSDDFSIFGMSVVDEFLNLYQKGIFNKNEIEKIINNGLNQIRSTKF